MVKWVEKIKQNHSVMMFLCCAIPLAALFIAVYYFGLSKSYLTWFVILLCPIMHIFMMRDMHKEHKEEADGISDKTRDTKAHNKKEGGCCN